jgi:hypothetical protein
MGLFPTFRGCAGFLLRAEQPQQENTLTESERLSHQTKPAFASKQAHVKSGRAPLV